MISEEKIRHLLNILELHQTPLGGFIASLDYTPYHKVWIRDHSFVTLVLHQLNERGMFRKACRFLIKWLKRTTPDLRVLNRLHRDEFLLNEELHPKARYFSDLSTVPGQWFERQYDGTALALAVLSKCHQIFNEPSVEELKTLADYLVKALNTPCADLWEIHPNWIHAETLGAIYFGLKNLSELASEYNKDAHRVAEFLIKRFHRDGIVRKMLNPEDIQSGPIGIDSSVLLLWTWFGVPLDLSILERTLNRIETRLSPDGLLLKRFEIQELGEIDTYFGGNPWVITTLWGGEAFMLLGDYSKAQEILRSFGEMFFLPEQILGHTSEISHFEHWRERAMQETKQQVEGPARILAWSHAEFLRFLMMFQRIRSKL